MKFCSRIFIFLMFIYLSIQSKWKTSFLELKERKIRIIHHNKVNFKYIPQAISILDRSMASINPFKKKNLKGLIRDDDVICVSTKMIYWFSSSSKHDRIIRSGGGLIAGMWEIKLSRKEGILFERKSKNGYVSNLLYPGSQPMRTFFGADINGGYKGSKVLWGLEYSKFIKITNKTGKDIIEYDKNMYSSDEGVFVEFTGLVGNSGYDEYIESEIDTDPRAKVIGKTAYILTYRIPAYKKQYLQEIVFKSIVNEFGPVNTINVSLYLPGYNTINMVYAANRELENNGKLKNVSVNKYFKNSCTNVYFYDRIFKNTKTKEASKSKLKIGCIGSPANEKPFICAYPGLEFLPKEAWNDFLVELTEDQSQNKIGRFHSINLTLLPSGKKTLNLKKGQSFSIIIKYKVIPSFELYSSSKTRIKE